MLAFDRDKLSVNRWAQLASATGALIWLSFSTILDFHIATVVAGLVITIAPLFFISWNQWRSVGSRFGGIFLLFPAAFIIIYTIGSLPIGDSAPLGALPQESQWVLYLWAISAFMVGATFFRKNAPIRPAYSTLLSGPLLVAVIAGMLGLLGAWTNFATGGIPLLAESINAFRFGQNSSLFGPLTGVFVGAEQAAFVVTALAWYSSRKSGTAFHWLPKVLCLAVLFSLTLTGSRSFVLLPVAAVLIATSEFRVIRLITLMAVIIVGFLGLTVYNQYRQIQSGTDDQLSAAIDARGLSDFPLASGLLGLQIGPSVLQLARDKIPNSIPFQDGKFFFADASPFWAGHSLPSDYWSTVYITDQNTLSVGGSPPTILGGLYIDGGNALVLVGMAVFGIASRLIRNAYIRTPTVYLGAAYGFWAAWLIQAIYSYVSLKPMVITYMVVIALGQAVSSKHSTVVRPVNLAPVQKLEAESVLRSASRGEEQF